MEEAGKITATVGADLAKNLLTDIIEGKNVKESARERGKEAGKQSLNLGTKRVIQKIQEPKVSPKATPRQLLRPPKAVKRPRSQSGGPKKKKPRKSQKGGIFSYFIAKEATKRVMDHERKRNVTEKSHKKVTKRRSKIRK